MLAAYKLKGINLNAVTIKSEGEYTGGFMNDKKHGLCLHYSREKEWVGNSSYYVYNSTW